MENNLPTLSEFLADAVKMGGNSFAKWIECTPDDRIFWEPCAEGEHKGRSMMDQAEECIDLNYKFLSMISHVPPAENRPKLSSKAEAIQVLRDSSLELSKAISGISIDDLAKEESFGPFTLPLYRFLAIAYFHLAYHGGAINYIQTLYGDKEFVFPGAE